ncbi:hypothetical protein CDD83_1963 [Cordyceps sp. RAO-2017]|nr:hypothetical protein CDD83_1963 [Cordyceps sp. RAO-2017]
MEERRKARKEAKKKQGLHPSEDGVAPTPRLALHLSRSDLTTDVDRRPRQYEGLQPGVDHRVNKRTHLLVIPRRLMPALSRPPRSTSPPLSALTTTISSFRQLLLRLRHFFLVFAISVFEPPRGWQICMDGWRPSCSRAWPSLILAPPARLEDTTRLVLQAEFGSRFQTRDKQEKKKDRRRRRRVKGSVDALTALKRCLSPSRTHASRHACYTPT